MLAALGIIVIGVIAKSPLIVAAGVVIFIGNAIANRKKAEVEQTDPKSVKSLSLSFQLAVIALVFGAIAVALIGLGGPAK